MLTLDETLIINIVDFHLSSSKLVKKCFEHDDKNLISSRPYSKDPNFHIKTSPEGIYWST